MARGQRQRVAGTGGDRGTRRRPRSPWRSPAPPGGTRDHAAAQVWGAIASGLGGRLFEALRDRRSLAYTVLASAWQKARGGALVTYIATSPEREDEAREQMLVELERFARRAGDRRRSCGRR